MNIKNHNKKNRSVAISWLLSYISVLLVPVVISGFLYIESINILYKEVTRANQSLLSEIQQIVDSTLRDMERISTEISFNDRINALLNTEKPLPKDGATTYDLIFLAKDLNLFSLGNDSIEDIYIHHRKSKTLIGTTARLSPDTFYDAYIKPVEGIYIEWDNFLNNSNLRDVLTLHGSSTTSSNSRFLLFKMPIYHQYGGQSDSDIIFIINEPKFFRGAREIMYTLSADINILDSKNEIITSTNYEKDYSFINYDVLTDKNGLVHKKSGKDEYVIMHTSSNIYEWKYLAIVNVKVFWEKVQYIKFLMQSGLALCLIIGGLVSLVFLKKNYGTINRLVNMIADKAGISMIKKGDELQFLQDVFTKTIGEKERVTGWMEQQGRNMRDNFLERLLKGRVEEGLSVDDSLNTHNIVSKSGCFAVLLLYIEDYSAFSPKEKKSVGLKEYKLVQFLITNIVEEYANQNNHGYVCEIDGMMACVISFDANNNDENIEELSRISNDAQRIIEEHFEIYLSISISNIHETLQGIAVAYQEALQAMEYKMVIGTGKILEYRDIRKDYSETEYKYFYPLQLEYQLINCVKAADIESANTIVHEIFEKNFSERSISIEMTKCLVFNIISTMIKALNEISELYGDDFASEIDPIQRLANCRTTEKMKLEIISIMQESCAYVEKNKRMGGHMLYVDIENYIKENYSDPGLSISKIGEHFNMAPSYVSKLYKEQTGGGLLDYIGLTRIEEAKLLWKNHNYTIQDAAKQVGYNDIKTFMRTFKKFEGITPGKFKELYCSTN